ncbi:hypothetical protein EON83_12630 [bacterium]|nr:MAG: hypothetical protein EON83_12630 [bacterium]
MELPHLTSDEREVAYALWEALVFADSPRARGVAEAKFAEAPFSIQQAILREIVRAFRQGHTPHSVANPFAPQL